jgi:6-phospho-3-hexuloisomerase
MHWNRWIPDRVMIAMEAWIKRFNHLGIPMIDVGALNEPALRPGDLLIVASGSGNTVVPVAIAKKAKSLGAVIGHICSSEHGEVAKYRDFMVKIPVAKNSIPSDAVQSVQPMTSLFEQSVFLLGDIISLMLVERRGQEKEKLWQCHANLE